MNIIVCVKEVPNPCLPVEVDIRKNAAKDEHWNYVINPCDEVAVEEAVRIKERLGGKVTVITMGPSRAEDVLRKSLSLGADKAIHLCDEAFAKSDAYATAIILSKAIGQLEFDLILCGSLSTDGGSGEVGCMMAEIIELPIITAVADLEIDATGRSATAYRRVEKGDREVKKCLLPAVLTADITLNEPRYPTFPAIKRSLRAKITKYDLFALDLNESTVGESGSLTEFLSISRPPPKKLFVPPSNLSAAERIKMLTSGTAEKKSSNLLEGSTEDIVKKLINFMTEKHFLPLS